MLTQAVCLCTVDLAGLDPTETYCIFTQVTLSQTPNTSYNFGVLQELLEFPVLSPYAVQCSASPVHLCTPVVLSHCLGDGSDRENPPRNTVYIGIGHLNGPDSPPTRADSPRSKTRPEGQITQEHHKPLFLQSLPPVVALYC